MPDWTKEQKSAIEDRGGTLLVSAAAGSGKTAVLTERVRGEKKPRGIVHTRRFSVFIREAEKGCFQR